MYIGVQGHESIEDAGCGEPCFELKARSRDRTIETSYALEVGCYPTKQASPKPFISYWAFIPTPRPDGLEMGLHLISLFEAPPYAYVSRMVRT